MAKEKSKPIGEKEVIEARSILDKYKSGKSNLEERIKENEKWFKLRHWDSIKKRNDKDCEPASAWLFNSIINKHADAMDNYPEPNVLPRESSDKKTAEMLSSVLPVILEQNNYEKVYSEKWWYKLKVGTSVEGVFWNPGKNNGLGDVEIKKIDILNLFWEPGISDIQDSQNVFHVMLCDNNVLEKQYESLKGTLGGNSVTLSQYAYDDTIDTTNKSAVIDWYYKKTVNGKQMLHYVKFVNSTVLFATENEDEYKDGLYNHGKYPFVFDTMYPIETSIVGFGTLDVMKSPQAYIDRLNQVLLKNALLACKPRFICKPGAINEDEFANWDNDIIHSVSGNVDEESIRQLTVNPLGGIYVTLLNNKIEELKETSGNRDFSQGSTSGGVTSGTAIASLMEAGSKLSRDQIKSSYRAFVEICNLIIENIRQFYDEPRCFRIVGQNGKEEFQAFDNSGLKEQKYNSEFDVDLGERLPIFDIRVTAQKSNPFSKLSQNELGIQLYQLGVFNPQMSDQALALLKMLDFENKNEVITIISRNGLMYQQLQQMQQQLAQMSALLDTQTGGDIGRRSIQKSPEIETELPSKKEDSEQIQNNSLGLNNPKVQTAQRAAENKVKKTTDVSRS